MSQSLSKIYLHFIFSTKNRNDCFKDTVFKQKLYQYITGIIKKRNCGFASIGGTENHVHVLLQINRTHSPAKVIEHIKRGSAIWIQSNNIELNKFQWQKGYGCFSVSHSMLNVVKNYIENQEQHHRGFDYKKELMLLCKKHDVEFDEQYW